MSGFRVLQFGQSGQLGRALTATAPRDWDVRALGRAEVDLSDVTSIASVIEAHAPQLVVNAAAYTQVDEAESDRETAYAVNAAAPAAMAAASARSGGALIHVSTDYVFDGEKAEPYVEDDPTGPLGVYGASKLAGEERVLAELERAVILRTSWVYSENGRNFVKTMLRLAQTHDELTIVDDQIGRPTAAEDLANAIWTAGRAVQTGGAQWGVFHFTGEGPAVSWAGFAEAILARAEVWSRRRPHVVRAPASAYPTLARRPKNSVMDCTRFRAAFGYAARDWRDALDETLERLRMLEEVER